MDRRARWGSASFVLLAVLLVGLCALGTTWRYVAVAAANVVPLVVLGVQLRRGTCVSRAGWLAMLGGVGFLVVHNCQNLVALAATGAPASGPLAAATLALGYAFLLPGGVVATIPHARRDIGGMLDAALVGLAVAVLMWDVALRPAHLNLGSSVARMAYELVLVLIVTALTGMIVRAVAVAVSHEARAVALVLLLAIVATDLSDVAYTLTEDPVTGMSAWWASAVAVVALLAFAAALVHPSVPAMTLSAHEGRGLTVRRLVLLGAALAVNPALAGIQALVGRGVDVALLIVGSLLTVPLVVWRIGLLARWHADATRRLGDLASLDELTGLPNRRAMTAHLEGLLARVADGASPGAVLLYLDVDDFKAVNDTHGHTTGDKLLRAVAARLRACVRSSDVVARFGGDEFVVVLEGEPETVASAVVPAIVRALAEPVVLGAVVASGRSSIGVAVVGPGEREDSAALLSRADAEMYRAKRRHRDRPTDPAPGSCRPTVVSME